MADPNCGTLAAGNAIDCDNLPSGGTEPNILLIKKTEWDLAKVSGTVTFDGTTPNLITDLVLDSGDKGYLFEGFQNSVKPLFTTINRASGIRYKQTIDYVVPGGKAEVDKLIKDSGNERYVVIYKNLFKDEDGEGKYKVLGVEAGLKRPEGGAEKDAFSDVDGVWMCKLESEEFALESTPMYTLYKTSEAVTDAIFVALQSAAA